MGQQQKLTNEQRKMAHEACNAISNMCVWSNTQQGHDYWRGVCNSLFDMDAHGTTDGKPWVEPKTAIPDGYRLAKDDEYRREDVKFWNSYANGWQLRVVQGKTFSNEDRYIVPIDRIPTDAEAMARPRVMVRNREDATWEEAEFYGHDEKFTYPFLAKSHGNWRQWKYCRYPYDGE